MNKGDSTMDTLGPCGAKEDLHVLPVAEVNIDRDEADLAVFGKRPQLKVCSPSPWLLALRSHNSEISASFPWLV